MTNEIFTEVYPIMINTEETSEYKNIYGEELRKKEKEYKPLFEAAKVIDSKLKDTNVVRDLKDKLKYDASRLEWPARNNALISWNRSRMREMTTLVENSEPIQNLRDARYYEYTNYLGEGFEERLIPNWFFQGQEVAMSGQSFIVGISGRISPKNNAKDQQPILKLGNLVFISRDPREKLGDVNLRYDSRRFSNYNPMSLGVKTTISLDNFLDGTMRISEQDLNGEQSFEHWGREDLYKKMWKEYAPLFRRTLEIMDRNSSNIPYIKTNKTFVSYDKKSGEANSIDPCENGKMHLRV